MLRRVVIAVAVLLSLALLPAAASAEGCENEGRRVEQHSTYLPDCRAYEMVSPPDKHGGTVMSMPSRTRAADDGAAVTFASLNGFGDVTGTGIATEYMGIRSLIPGTDGWSVHGLFPKVEPLSVDAAGNDLDSYYQAELSGDLSTGIFSTFTNLSGRSEVSQVANLYLRKDLRTPGEGSYELLTACPVCTPLTPLTLTRPRSFVADTTPDFGHIIFESRSDLLEGLAGEQPKLYEWDHGTLYLAGILPASQGGGPALRSVAGVGAQARRYTLHTISDDGSRIFFTASTSAGSGVGQLYMRVNHSSTVQLNASERSECVKEPSSCPEPSAQEPAQYQTATGDGSRVYFVSPEQLTDTPGSGLYMYDTTRPDSDPHNLTLLSPDNEPADQGEYPLALEVMGASEDGSYVYFATNSQLVAGAPTANQSYQIYLWHKGTLTYIGVLSESQDADQDGLTRSKPSFSPLASRVTPDGKHLLFTSHSGAGLTGYDHGSSCTTTNNGGCSELYLYTASSNKLVCVSCNPSGAAATTEASFLLEEGQGGSVLTAHLNHPLSDDGRYVFFTTGEKLRPEDRNGKVRDVYEYDSVTGTLHLITSGTSTENSYFLDASPDGHDVFFATGQRLLGWDTDNSVDLYDARVGGGLPEPQAQTPECTGDACQGTLSQPLAPAQGGSATFFEGSGNVSSLAANAPVARRVTNTQRLARALQACRRRPKRQRGRCVAQARRRYDAKSAVKASGRGR